MPKKTKRKTTKKTKPQSKSTKVSKKTINISIIILLIILAILAIVLLVQLGLIENPLERLFLTTESYEIRDECSVIVGQLIHTIGDEGQCELKCKNNCEVVEKEYQSFEFRVIPNNCNRCTCYCR